MTDMEKKVMVRLCAKIVADTNLYETDKEVQNLIDWVCISEQIKENNNTIRNLTGEYKRIEPDCLPYNLSPFADINIPIYFLQYSILSHSLPQKI